MKIALETSLVDHQSGSGARSGLGREEKTNESPCAEGGTEELTRVNHMIEPKKENISELDDKSPVARVPPLILFISPEKAEQSPKKRKVLHFSEGSSSPLNNNNVIDSSVLESTENTHSDVVNSPHLSSPEFKCDDCPSAFSTSQELLLHNLEEHFRGEIDHKNGGKDTDCNKFGCEKKKKNAGGRQSSFTQEQLSLLRSNFSVNKYPSREDMMQITKAVGQPYEKVAKWFDNSRVKDKRQQGKGKLPRRLKCPNCDEIISKFNGYHRFTRAGHKDSRKEEHEAEVKNDNVVVEMRQEKVSKGQGDLSKLDNQPGADVASQSETRPTVLHCQAPYTRL